MATSESIEPAGRLFAILGLPPEASPSELSAAYRRLHGHIEARARRAPDAESRSRHRAERELLTRQLDEVLRAEPSSPLAPAVSSAVETPRRRVAVPIGWAALGALLLAVVLGIASWLERRATPVEPARIAIRADPPGALAQLLAPEDDHVVASGPADGSQLVAPAGQYTLRVVHPDCPETWSRSLAIGAGEARDYAPLLCRGEGGLVVRSNVSEDRTLIDGLDVGSTGAAVHALRVGGHSVEVRKQGYRPWSGQVQIRPEEQITLHAELEPETSGQSGSPASTPKSSEPATPASPRTSERPALAQTPGGLAAETSSGRPLPPRTGMGGSKSWHDAIKSQLVTEYDRNGSRSLDVADEIQSIPCSVWQSVEESYETGGLGVDMTHLYGFDGSPAPANTLGITHEMRGYAYDRMTQCGLRSRR